jgi:hypothetical protein
LRSATLLLRQLDAWLNSGEGRCSQGVGHAVPVASATTATLRGKEEETSWPEQFELIEDFQLQIEHAMDMKDRQLVLFIDAGMNTPSPFAFYRAMINDEQVLYSHSLSPEALIKVYTQFYNEAPPLAYVLCISGASFELGEPLSTSADANLTAAFEFARGLMDKPDAQHWDAQCTQTAVIIRSAQETNQITR